MNALGIDVGSSNVKTVMVDPSGSVVMSAVRPLRTSHSGDAVTQDPQDIWQAVRTTITDVVGAAPDAAAQVTDIGVCSQYSSLVTVDANGVPTGPVIMYLDRRGTDLCWQIMERHPDAFERFVERHGIPPIGAGLTLSHILSVEHEQPEVAGNTKTYLEVMDFVNLLLTGRAAATQATMFASQLCDNRVIGVTSYDEDLVAMAGVARDHLPELVALGSTIGEVRSWVADKLGLPPGVRVHTGMNDTQAAAFATGVLSGSSATGEHSVGMMIGTTGVVIDTAPGHRVDLDHEVLTMPSPLAGRHLVMAENGLAGRSVERFFELMALDPFSGVGLEEFLGRSAAGASGVLFLPWLDGSMSPSADASIRGGLLGVGLTTTRDDLVRAAVEGTAFNLGWLLPAVEELTGQAADRIAFGGGAARSPGWAQVLADVTQRPVDVLAGPEIAAATAVARAALCVAGGEDPAGLSAVISTTHEPDPATAGLYATMQEQFQIAFSQNRGICEALGHG